MRKFIFPFWIVSSLGLLFYSFTQVDLSLTLSQVSIWQYIQKAFQYIGYFDRPLSTLLFLIVIGVMFLLYAITLNLIKKKAVDQKKLWKIIICVAVILFISYNAFSYDLFNYIFDAKIVTHYHANPYEHKALDYPGDPMLSFMHWTHRTYPYGPVWLLLTIPLSFVGFGYFLVTFYLFKLLMMSSFILSVYLVGKIAQRLKFNKEFSMAAFALNPLVLVESLVSAHLDIVMIAIGLFGIFLFIEKKYIVSSITLSGSILVKFATALLIPALIFKLIFKSKDSLFVYILIFSMIAATILSTMRTNFQPWYLLIILPFTSLIQNKYFIIVPVFILSIAALLQYAPFLYLGNWDPPVPLILNQIMIGSIAISFVLILVWKIVKRV